MDPQASQLRLALAAALVSFAALTAAFWADTAALLGPLDPEALRARVFQGVPADALDAALDERLDPEEPVSLAPALRENDFLVQRLTEAFYPRRVEDGAASVLDVARVLPARALDPQLGVPLARMDDLVFVVRSDRLGAEPAAAPAPRRGGSWLATAASALGAIGVGLLACALVARRAPIARPLALATAVVLGALVQGVLASVATWLEVALPATALAVLGLASAGVALVLALRRPGAAGSLVRWLCTPEHALFAALLALLLVRGALLPIAGWDGRSIWLLQAHRLFAHGRVPVDELRSATALWSHADYPLLLPAWLASFSALAHAFDERAAALAIAVLLAACLALVWQLARPWLGRAAATAYALAVLLAIDRATAGGYADGFLLCFLVIQFLAFASRDDAAVGWIAAGAASLVKAEGLVLATTLAALFALDTWRRTGAFSLRRLAPCLVFAPAAIHLAWTRALGADSLLKGEAAGAIAAAFVPRLVEAVRAAPALWQGQGPTHVRALLWAGSAALVATALLWAWRGGAPRIAKLALAAAVVWTGFAFTAVSGLPEDPRWFVETALDRLLLHPAGLLLLVPFLVLTPRQR